MSVTVFSLWKSGALDTQISLGIIRYSVIEYCQITEEFNQFKSKGYGYVRAVELTAEKLCLTEAKVRVAVSAVN